MKHNGNYAFYDVFKPKEQLMFVKSLFNEKKG